MYILKRFVSKRLLLLLLIVSSTAAKEKASRPILQNAKKKCTLVANKLYCTAEYCVSGLTVYYFLTF